MKYRTKQLTRIQRYYRKANSRLQSKGLQFKMRPRWRQIKKERAKRWQNMDI